MRKISCPLPGHDLVLPCSDAGHDLRFEKDRRRETGVVSRIQDMHYKQCSPVETVGKLQQTLKNLNVKVDETWQEKSSIDTYALRLDFKGTSIGVNGKGVSKEFARASAYADFFERYQNDILGPRVSFGSKFPFYVAPDEKLLSSSEVVAEDNAFIRQYFELRDLQKANLKKKAEKFYNVQKVDYHVYGLDDQYICLPFYSVRDKKNVYLPKCAYTPFYGSNGMCAGNTAEDIRLQLL